MDKEVKQLIEVTGTQADNIAWLFEYSKALASPLRLALIGALAGAVKQTWKTADLAERFQLRAEQLEKELQQLTEAGIIQIIEEVIPEGKREPQIQTVQFNSQYLAKMPVVIGVLNSLNTQLFPEAADNKPKEEREKTLHSFFKGGKLVTIPVQLKKQVWVMEEIAKSFKAQIDYKEAEIDAILKEIYPEDHCTLRRNLVDMGFFSRHEGVYRKLD